MKDIIKLAECWRYNRNLSQHEWDAEIKSQ